MNKFTLALLLILCTIFISACGAGDVGRPGYVSSQVESSNDSTELEKQQVVDDTAYKNNIDGLRQYMLDGGYIAGEPTTMSAGIIGAAAGYKYEFRYKRAGIAVELYEYDLDNLNDKANSIINQINETGTFSIQNINVESTMSNNGKYIMICRIDNNSSEMTERKQEITNAFVKFKA